MPGVVAETESKSGSLLTLDEVQDGTFSPVDVDDFAKYHYSEEVDKSITSYHVSPLPILVPTIPIEVISIEVIPIEVIPIEVIPIEVIPIEVIPIESFPII
ncbi:hypothetical protein GNI_054030 [Gregarina niphandrodes]|uniref:Uncharacterized protein n=1 Tax=Gregarina niphandrodes TaxID=110365 RepID=A0A023B918_GRENI|nr:hypothetical protein GNI_054030 [Gregarina niphandrodes]EZG70842.1 hypothetical protein GNI_054030 [Gregarina niphandrodes]|eukprot:XP_011129860.1 hypothetical protein GNI_054030 [Gregarina niphandrodes]